LNKNYSQSPEDPHSGGDISADMARLRLGSRDFDNDSENSSICSDRSYESYRRHTDVCVLYVYNGKSLMFMIFSILSRIRGAVVKHGSVVTILRWILFLLRKKLSLYVPQFSGPIGKMA
jgi:hypothetical protein